jgi:hypothetical protein
MLKCQDQNYLSNFSLPPFISIIYMNLGYVYLLCTSDVFGLLVYKMQEFARFMTHVQREYNIDRMFEEKIAEK